MLRPLHLPLGDRELAARLRVRRLGDLHRHLRGEMILVGDAAGLQQAVGAILLGSRMCAIGFGHVEIRLGAIARQPEVGVVQHGEQLTASHAIAFGLEHAFEARRDLGNDGDLRRADRACLSATASPPDRGSARLPCARESLRIGFDRRRLVSASVPAAGGGSRPRQVARIRR